jgi:hypothetical protein
MCSAFKNLFKVSDEIANAPAVEQWMEDAPIRVVEYPDELGRENKREKDRRMELIEAYDGNVGPLAKHLRSVFPEYKDYLKWEIVFKVYDEITAAQKSIEQAELQVVFGKNEGTGEVSQASEELQNGPSASTEKNVSDVAPSESEQTQQGEQTLTDSVSSQESHEEIETETSSDMPSGNVQEKEAEPLFKQNKMSIKEDTKMEETVTELLKAAETAGTQATEANPGEVQHKKSNTDSVKKADKAAKAAAASVVQGTLQTRNAWTRQHVVTGLVSTQKPAALRTKTNMGTVVPGVDDPDKALEKINEKINHFIVLVSGQDNLSQDAFEALPDNNEPGGKWANVCDDNEVNIKKARAIYELCKQIKQNPLGEVPAYIPGDDKVSYPTRGYVVDGNPLTVDEFIIQVCDNGVGVLYAEGSMDEQGNDIGDKPTYFKIGITSKTEAKKADAPTTQQTVQKKQVPCVRPVNKKEFTAGGSHIQFLFTQEDTEQEGRAAFKAAITVEGELMNATVATYKIKDGKREVTDTVDKDGNPKFKKRIASISVSVPVTKIKREFAAEYKEADESIAVTASRWGVAMSVEKQKGNFGNIADIASSPILEVFANVYDGNLKLSKEFVEGSSTIKLLQEAANKQAEADAAQSADELE